MKIKFWGVRGSVPTPGPSTARVGGNTSCVEVRAAGQLLIFDLGTGARPLGGALLAEQPVWAQVFLSHLHHDHTQGLPFFVPAFLPGTSLTFHALAGRHSLREALETVFEYPYFPVPLRSMASRREYVELAAGQRVVLAPGLEVLALPLNHPDGALGYRVEAVENGVKKVFAYCTDNERSPDSEASVRALAADADVFVHDAQYTDEEYPSKVGWGHSTVTEAARFAAAAGAKRLFLFHHDPAHDDDKVLAMEAQARAHFTAASAAVEGFEVEA